MLIRKRYCTISLLGVVYKAQDDLPGEGARTLCMSALPLYAQLDFKMAVEAQAKTSLKERLSLFTPVTAFLTLYLSPRACGVVLLITNMQLPFPGSTEFRL